jgi:hypothetical protein
MILAGIEPTMGLAVYLRRPLRALDGPDFFGAIREKAGKSGNQLSSRGLCVVLWRARPACIPLPVFRN